MATPQLSPGVLIREVDLTVGRADNVLDNIGAIAGPFQKGPVGEVTDIATEQELINVFGKPLSSDNQYEYWMSASSFLSYGGVLKVVRTDDDDLNNANAAVGYASTTAIKIKNYDDYVDNYADEAEVWAWAAKTPGSINNNLKVAIIDNAGDQTLGVTTSNLANIGCSVGVAITIPKTGKSFVKSDGGTESFTGYIQGIVTGVRTDATTPANSEFDIKIVSRTTSAGVSTVTHYQEGDTLNSVFAAESIQFYNSSGIQTGASLGHTVGDVKDWYDNQKIELTNSTIFWKSLAPKPGTTNYADQRNGVDDEVHVVVVDDEGTVTGIQGNLLEKHTGLSKSLDAISAENSPERIFWKDYLARNSEYVYAGKNPSSVSDGHNSVYALSPKFTTTGGFVPQPTATGLWNQKTQGLTFSAIGNALYTLKGGVNYDAATNGFQATLASTQTAYNFFRNKDEVAVDYILYGPGTGTGLLESQAKASYIMAIANERKDCMAVISPDKGYATSVDKILEFFSPLPSNSYSTFDSGYAYKYDRFNDKFRYVPTNADVAGLMVRTAINAYPWFSPAGQQRGIFNNATKLLFNPSKADRDKLYPARINSIINMPGTGVMLFGDKTALSYASAFDRINVRRLFLTVEQALERSANAQLFELNDEITRSNFVNIVEPYLRDVQAKRGLYDFLVICDETNNTPDVIDNNEFRADIFLKPTKSINYVTVTFVATRTGVSFEEVAGRV